MSDLSLPRAGGSSRQSGRAGLHVWVFNCWAIFTGLGTLTALYGGGQPLSLRYVTRTVIACVLSTGVMVGVFLVAIAVTRSRKGIRKGDVAALLCLAVLLAVTRQVLDDAIWCAFGAECWTHEQRLKYRLRTLPVDIAVMVNMVAIAWSVRAITLSRENRILRRAARTELLRAQMRTLESHLRPHFLFNALQSTTTLMHREPASARSMLLGIRRLLQHSVQSAERPEVPLREELEVIELYLNVESLRFGRRLEIRIDAGPETLEAAIPPFLLQPLVENAVHHAIALRGQGRIEVASTLDPRGDRLNLVISDTGAGSETQPREGGAGAGLQNVRSRLSLLYGGNWALRSQISGDGTVTTISIPFRVLPAHQGARAPDPALHRGFAL